MSSREERTVELTVISAQDLKKVKTFGKQESYVTAYFDSRMKRTTKVDKEGSLNPAWNSKLTLLVDEAIIQGKRGSITLEIHCQGAFGSKLVGTSSLHLSDLSLKEGSDGQFMALEVRRPSGKAKGLLNVSIALGEKRTIQTGYQAPRMASGQGSSNPAPPVTAYPAGGSYNYNPQPPSYGGYPAQGFPQQGYPQPGYPQQGYPQQGYPQQGYAPQPPGPYGYAPPPQPYGGYPQQGYYQQPPRRSGFGGGGMGGMGGAGLGLGAGLLGGLLVGDAIGNLGDNDTYVDNNYYGDSGGGDGGGDYDGGGGDFDGGGGDF